LAGGLRGARRIEQMSERNTCLKAFIEALAADQPHLFEQAVKAAYKVGASREDLLAAVEIARRRAEIPAATLSHAYATVHAWHWLAARRMEHRRNLMPA